VWVGGSGLLEEEVALDFIVADHRGLRVHERVAVARAQAEDWGGVLRCAAAAEVRLSWGGRHGAAPSVQSGQGERGKERELVALAAAQAGLRGKWP
jgi:hypothetical protein